MDTFTRLQLTISYLITFSLLIGVFTSLFFDQYLNAFLAALSLLLSFIPAVIRRSVNVFLPIEFDFFLAVFLYLSIYLGTVREYYSYFWWWDLFLHTIAGLLMGVLGFLIIYLLSHARRQYLHLSPFLVALFSFSFSLTIGVFWEIFEFVLDQVFGFDMQHGSLQDTMFDFIADALGALLVSIMAYFYTKKVPVPLFDRFLKVLTLNLGMVKSTRTYQYLKTKNEKIRLRWKRIPRGKR